MNFDKKYKKGLLLTFLILAVIIVSYVLFSYPQPGVADQGDFDRIMSVSGLELTDAYKGDNPLTRFYDYTVTDYKISNFTVMGLGSKLLYFGMTYLIVIISTICKIFGQDIFKTTYLAIAYSAIYIATMYIIIKYLNITSKFKLTVLALLSLFVFFDGNYLIWFNSLYGEPMMLTSLLMFLATFVYYVNKKYVVKTEKGIFSRVLLILITAFLFLGSKLQVLSALPIMAIILIKVLYDNRKVLRSKQIVVLSVLCALILIYPVVLNKINTGIGNDTQYNSVFYGVLNGSETPEQDLIDMGLNPDMAVEAGKHAYLDPSDYVKYVPRTEITEREFYSKMGNGKLIKFYITHPIRLIKGMEYTASKAFITSTSLGMYPESYSKESIREFNRFTGWSEIKQKALPKHFIFIVLVYILVFTGTLYEIIKNKSRKDVTNIIQLIWVLMAIAMLQFPMPYVGNGQADTAKQLFLFNFIFDIILVISVTYILGKLFDFIKHMMQKNI